LGRQSLGAVVKGPARIAGIRVDDELVDRLVADTDSGAALPLLAFALAELARDVGRGDELSAARYDQLGGVQGALTRQADAALADAMQAEGRSRDDVLAGLLRLVTVDEQGNPTSWRVDRSELPGTVDAELDAFVARRLLVTDTGDDGSAVVGVAHEAFLTAWEPLGAAIDAEATALRARRAVEHSAAEWDSSGRSNERLWERGRLAAAVADTGARVRSRAVVTDRVPLSATAREFLLASIRHDRFRRGRTTAILSVLCALTLVAAGIAIVEQGAAQQNLRTATARQLIAQADVLREAAPQTALMLDIAAERIHSDADTRAALVAGLLSSRYAGTLTGHTAEANDPVFTADGRVMATGGHDGTVILWDIGGERPRPLGPPITSDVELFGQRTFSPDGRILATERRNGTVQLWDVSAPSAPRPIGRPFPTAARVDHLEYAPDGRTLVIGGGYSPAAVELWDISDPASARRLGEPVTLPGSLRLLAFHPSGTALITGTREEHRSSIVVWDVADPARPHPIGTPLVYAGKAAFHAGTLRLAVNTDPFSSVVTIWDLRDPAAPRPLPGVPSEILELIGANNESVDLLEFTPDGAVLAVASGVGSGMEVLRLWDISDREPRANYREPAHVDGQISDVAFTPDRSTLVTVSLGGSEDIVRVWDLTGPTANQIGQSIGGPGGFLGDTALLPNGRTILTDRADGALMMWDLLGPGTPHRLGPPISDGSEVSSLAFVPQPVALVIARRDGSIERLAIAGSPEPGPVQQIRRAAAGDASDHAYFAPRTGLIAVAESDGSIVVTDAFDESRAGRIPKPFPGGRAKPRGFTPDGRILAVGVTVGTVTMTNSYLTLWDVGDPAHPRSLGQALEAGDDSGTSFSPDGQLLARVVGDAEASGVELIDISDPTTPKPIGDRLTGHTDTIRAVAFSADGTVLATGSSDHTIILWDVADRGRPRRVGLPLSGHADAVQSLALSPDGRTLASGGREGKVLLWDLTVPTRPRRLGSPLTGDGPTRSALQFSADGNMLATGDLLGRVNMWDLTGLNTLRDNARQSACHRTGRGLNPDEWARYITGPGYEDTCSS
jgi:WD40 repeat protein